MAPATKTINEALDDDDSEDDSDYCPEDDKDVEEGYNVEVEVPQLAKITVGRKRKVDDLWAAMQDESVSTKKSTAVSSSSSGKSGKRKSSSKKNKDILAAIFGKSQSEKIVSGVSSKTPADKADELRIKEAARESVKMLQKKTTVSETRKFAGQSITIERTVQGSMGTVKPTSTAPKMSALDNVLDTIKGPKNVNTVAKSGLDWDTYKEKEGLEDDLAAAAKEGFLTRKDFLQRCDYRAYEQERDDRMLKSSSSGSK